MSCGLHNFAGKFLNQLKIMKKYFIAIMLLLLASLSSLRAEDKPVILHPSSTTHGAGQGKKPRTPAYVPKVYIDGHVLSFEESCIGYPITGQCHKEVLEEAMERN